MNEKDSKKFQKALETKAAVRANKCTNVRAQGIGPNKAAGRKGGIRRQGSKR